MFGLAGAHRSGKTTLAKRVAEDLGIHYHDASISKFAKELNINAVGDLPVAERVKVQEHILKRYCEEIDKIGRDRMPAITDRTPLDMIGYMLGEVTMHSTTPEDGKLIAHYVDRCLAATLRHFDTIIVLRPLPTYTADPKSPPESLAYQWQNQMIVEGALAQLNQMPLQQARLLTVDLEQRAECTQELILERLAAWADDRKSMRLN
jgi:hypothetical protein